MPLPEVIVAFFKSPGTFVPRLDYLHAVSFLMGVDEASNGAVLGGYREWLIVKLNDGDNLNWCELFHQLIWSQEGVRVEERPISEQLELIRLLGESLTEFSQQIDEYNGRMKIYLRYYRWLQSQSWYREELQWRTPL